MVNTESRSHGVEVTDLLILAAVSAEWSSLRKLLDRPRNGVAAGCLIATGEWFGRRAVLARTGMGEPLALRNAERLIACLRPRTVLLAGLSGGLHPELEAGHIVIATGVRHESHDEVWPTESEVDSRSPRGSNGAIVTQTKIHRGLLVTTSGLLRTPSEKRAVADRTGAIAVDMESHGVARAAQVAGVPLRIVRAILDDVRACLDERLADCVDERGLPSIRGISRQILRDPRFLWNLLQTGRGASRALAALQQAMRVLID